MINEKVKLSNKTLRAAVKGMAAATQVQQLAARWECGWQAAKTSNFSKEGKASRLLSEAHRYRCWQSGIRRFTWAFHLGDRAPKHLDHLLLSWAICRELDWKSLQTGWDAGITWSYLIVTSQCQLQQEPLHKTKTKPNNTTRNKPNKISLCANNLQPFRKRSGFFLGKGIL